MSIFTTTLELILSKIPNFRRGFNADEVKQELFLREEKDFALPWLFLDFRHAGGCGRNARCNPSINNLSLTGSAIESGDEGVVGRGNRYNGVIPFTRHMSMESCCGKNPVYHVGKLYTAISSLISEEIFHLTGLETYVYLTSQMGRSLSDPWFACVDVCDKEQRQRSAR